MACNLEWKNQSTVLVQAMNSLRLNDAFVDVTLAADGKFIRVHRLILCACSPYLQELLGQQQSNSQAIIFLKDVPYWQLKLIVDYMYQGSIEIQREELESFIQTAKSLQILGITESFDDGNFHQKETEVSQPDSLKVMSADILNNAPRSHQNQKRSSCSPLPPMKKFPKIERTSDLSDQEEGNEVMSQQTNLDSTEFLNLEWEIGSNNDRQMRNDDEPRSLNSEGNYEAIESNSLPSAEPAREAACPKCQQLETENNRLRQELAELRRRFGIPDFDHSALADYSLAQLMTPFPVQFLEMIPRTEVSQYVANLLVTVYGRAQLNEWKMSDSKATVGTSRKVEMPAVQRQRVIDAVMYMYPEAGEKIIRRAISTKLTNCRKPKSENSS